MKTERKGAACLLLLFLVLFLASVIGGNSVSAQSMTTMGTDFWVSFARGLYYDPSATSVSITGLRDCTVMVSNPNMGWLQTRSLGAGEIVMVDIDPQLCLTEVSNAIENKGIHITASDTVSVYASNYKVGTFDATFVLPTSSLRDDYMMQNWECNNPEWPAEILVVATEDSTTIDIEPTTYSIGFGTNIQTITRTLMRGQTYLLKTGAQGDYSGTVIKAREGKRIAVFGCHEHAQILGALTYGDRLFEQIVPTTYWGKEFVLVKSGGHNGDKFKVTSLRDSCLVWKNNTYLTRLEKGESYVVELNNNEPTCYLKSSGPVVVYSYMVSKGTGTGNENGDPSMVFETPVEQQLKDVVFMNYNYTTQLTRYFFINIVTRNDNVSNIRLDEVEIASSFQVLPANTEYAYAIIQSTAGPHNLKSLGTDGFIARAYGVGANESFGYSVGFATKNITSWFTVDDQKIDSDQDTLYICQGDCIPFTCVGSYENDSIRWNFGDGTTSVGDSLTHCYDSAGVYEVSAYASSNSQKDRMRAFIMVYPNVWNVLEGTGCDSVVVGGQTFLSSVDDTLTYTNRGCDSVLERHITVYHSKSTVIEQTIFEGDTLWWIDGHGYCEEGDNVSLVLHTVEGCDSIVTLRLHLIEPDTLTLWAPNVFTPNNETNTEFRIFSNGLATAHVAIFNRWGLKVVEFDGLTESWDGTYKGEPCKQDAYVYIIEYTSERCPDRKQKKVGTVTILR